LATKKAKKDAKKQNAIQRFVRETIGELKKVTWPTSREAWQLTQVVLAVLLIMAVFLGLIVDGIARQLLKLLLGG
jgi:preprotein translocase subunit SecE